MKRHIILLSDGTGITVETLGNSLISQFDTISFSRTSMPYIDSIDKANDVVKKIHTLYKSTGERPIVFMTVINSEIIEIIDQSPAVIFDLFSHFLTSLEGELGVKPSKAVGKTHGVVSEQRYSHRIEAVDYALIHDDGVRIKGYDKADIVLIGVSRSGKTPSCLYMALHFGIFAANYPFTDEDLHCRALPKCLQPFRKKLFGLTIDVERLQQIRHERRPNSRYSSAEQCRIEISEIEDMYRKEKIPYINSTRYSIEEISTKILSIAGMKRKI